MTGYRLWYVEGRGDYDVFIQTGDQVLDDPTAPGAYVHNTGKLACLDADDLDALARAATEAAADVRQRTAERLARLAGEGRPG